VQDSVHPFAQKLENKNKTEKKKKTSLLSFQSDKFHAISRFRDLCMGQENVGKHYESSMTFKTEKRH
jgi:hypothetical protein